MKSKRMIAFGFITVFGILNLGCTGKGNFGNGFGRQNGNSEKTGSPGAAKFPSTSDATKSAVTGIPCDVLDLLQDNCAGCHGDKPEFGAVGSVTSWDGLDKSSSESGKKLRDLVIDRLKGNGSIMPPPPAAALKVEQIATIENWLKAGAPRSNEQCEVHTTGEHSHAAPTLNCTVDQKVRPSAPYVVPADAPLNDYVCYGFDVNNADRRQITALAPHIDNSAILHHILLFESPTAYPSTPQRCGMASAASWKLVAGWAPGNNAVQYPDDVGYPQAKGVTHYVMQLHYNYSQHLPNQEDASGFDFCTTGSIRPNNAGVLAFGGLAINIPPRSDNYRLECSYMLPNTMKEVHFLGGSPHMHQRGKSASLILQRANAGEKITLVDVPNYSYHDQSVHPINQTAHAGDTVTTTCAFSNPTDQRINFGEKTEDEMCFNFVGYYPAVPDQYVGSIPIFSWITPSIFASCRQVN